MAGDISVLQLAGAYLVSWVPGDERIYKCEIVTRPENMTYIKSEGVAKLWQLPLPDTFGAPWHLESHAFPQWVPP